MNTSKFDCWLQPRIWMRVMISHIYHYKLNKTNNLVYWTQVLSRRTSRKRFPLKVDRSTLNTVTRTAPPPHSKSRESKVWFSWYEILVSQKTIKGTFGVLLTKKNFFKDMPFCKNFAVTLVISSPFVSFSYLSLQLKHGTDKCNFNMFELRQTQKREWPQYQQFVIRLGRSEERGTSQGSIEAAPSLIREAAVLVTTAFVHLDNNETVN